MRGEDRVSQERQRAVAERRRVQGSAEPHAADLGRRSHLPRRLPRSRLLDAVFIITEWHRINRTIYFCRPSSVFLRQNT